MKTISKFLAIALCLALSPSLNAGIVNYSQDFESLDINDTAALGDDGWLVGANVFDSGGGFVYNYFSFPAPNDGGGFSRIETGFGDAPQGAQQLSIFNDYNNANHGDGSNFVIEANVFRDTILDASDIGRSVEFTFDGRLSNLAAPSTAGAFIKTIDPGAGFATTNLVFQDMTAATTAWDSFTLSLDLTDPLLDGQILQIGFVNTASNFNPSGIFYDNITISRVPEPGSFLLFATCLVGLGARRKK